MRRRVFWAGVASRAHVIYGASWLRGLDGEVSVTLFPTRRFIDAPHLGLDEVAQLLPRGVTLSAWEGAPHLDPDELPAMLSVGAVGVKPWLALRRGLGTRSLPVVVTDEGLGTYGNWFSRRAAWQREGVREPWLSVRTTAVLSASAALTSRRWALHERGRQGWAVNPAVADEFRRHARPVSGDGGAVFLSQPWPELGVMSEATYLDHVSRVADACATAGLTFTVHPHPAEDPERYAAWPVHRAHGPAEIDAVSVDATVLLGATSTAMLNIAAVHGVPAMRVGTPELERLDQALTPRQTSLLRQHVGLTVASGAWVSTLRRLGVAARREPRDRS